MGFEPRLTECGTGGPGGEDPEGPFRVAVGLSGPGEGLGRGGWGRRLAGPQHPSLCAQAKLAVLLLTLVVATISYLTMEQKLRRGVVPRQPRIPRPQHKVRGYRYLEEDNSDESDAEGERGDGGGWGEGAEEEAPPAGPRPGPEPAGLCRRPCPYEQAQGVDGPEEQQ